MHIQPKNSVKFLTKVRCLVVAAILVASCSRDQHQSNTAPGWDFSDVTRKQDTERLLEMQRSFQQIGDWQPKFADAAGAITQQMGQFRNQGVTVEHWEQLRLFSDRYAVDAGLAALARLPEAGSQLGEVMNQANPKAKIEDLLKLAVDRARHQARCRLLEDEDARKLHHRLGVPKFPANDLVAAVDWLESFTKEVEIQVKPVAEWYARIDTAVEILAQIDDAKWRRTGEFSYQRFNSVANFELVARRADGSGEGRFFESLTGIRVRLAKPFDLKDGNGIQLDLAANRLEVASAEFGAFLHDSGLPEALEVVPGASVSALQPLEVRFALRHQQLGDFGQWTWRLGEEFVGQTDWRGLIAENLAAAQNYRRMGCSFEEPNPSEEPKRFEARLQPAPSLKFDVSVTLGENGLLFWPQIIGNEAETTMRDEVMEKLPELEPVAAFVSLRRIRLVDETPAAIVAELNVAGSALGLPENLGEIPCRLSHSGTLQIGSSGRTARYVESIGKPNPTPHDLEYSRQELKDALLDKFPGLKGVLSLKVWESSPRGQIFALALELGDWPTLQLGPEIVASGQKPLDLAERWLDSDTVSDVAKLQWAGKLAHPRYGRVRSTLQSFDAQKAVAVVHNVVRIPVLEQDFGWDERVELKAQGWKSFGGKEISEQLGFKQPQLVSGLRHLCGYDKFDVRLAQDAYGPGTWLRLHPFEIALDADLVLPVIDLKVAVGRMSVGAEGVKWPRRMSLAWKTTFPSPTFAISDPQVLLDLNQQRLDLSAKVTPPVPPLPKNVEELADFLPENSWVRKIVAFGEGSSARLDNPWLYAFYLRGDIGGQLRSPEFGGRGTLVLGKKDLVEGGGSYRVAPPKFDLTVATRPVPKLPYFPNFYGHLGIGGDGAQLDGEFNLRGIDGRGKFEVAWEVEGPPQLEIYALAELPWVGEVALWGHADLDFKTYHLQCKKTTTIWLGKPTRVEKLLILDQTGVQLSWTILENQRTVSREFASIDEMDIKAVQVELEAMRAMGPAPKIAPGVDAAAPKLRPERARQSISSVAERQVVGSYPAAANKEGTGDLDIKVEDNAIEFRNRNSGKVTFRTTRSETGTKVGHRHRWVMARKGDRMRLIVFDRTEPRLMAAEYNLAGQRMREIDVAGLPDPLPQRSDWLETMSWSYFLIARDDGKEPKRFRAMDSGFAFDFLRPSDRLDMTHLISPRKNGGRVSLFIAHDPKTPSHAELQQYARKVQNAEHLPSRLHLCGSGFLYSRTYQDWGLRRDFAGEEDAATIRLLDPQADLPLKEAAWLTGRPAAELKSAQIMVGTSGLAILQTEQLTLLPRDGLESGQPVAFSLTKQLIQQWPHPSSARHLPPGWDSETKRAAKSLRNAAVIAISPWKASRDSWDVQPMALFEQMAHPSQHDR